MIVQTKMVNLVAKILSSPKPNVSSLPHYKVLVNKRVKGTKIVVGRNIVTIVSKRKLSRPLAEEIIKRNLNWINEQARMIEMAPSVSPILPSDHISWLGVDMEVRFQEGKVSSAKFEDDYLLVKARDIEGFRKTLKSKLKREGKLMITDQVNLLASKYGFKFNEIRVRDTRSRWGSCSGRKNLNFSWRLCLAPQDVMDYVIIHELAHTKVANHSPEFWSIVSSIIPDYKVHRKWLKANGEKLFFV